MENKTQQIKLKDYPLPLQKILYDMFEEHNRMVELTYHSCKIEGSKLSLDEVHIALKPNYMLNLNEAIELYKSENSN